MNELMPGRTRKNSNHVTVVSLSRANRLLANGRLPGKNSAEIQRIAAGL